LYSVQHIVSQGLAFVNRIGEVLLSEQPRSGLRHIGGRVGTRRRVANTVLGTLFDRVANLCCSLARIVDGLVRKVFGRIQSTLHGIHGSSSGLPERFAG